jgi:hypothetical protein
MFHGNWANLSGVTRDMMSGSKRKGGVGLERGGNVPGQQLHDLVDRMFCDRRQNCAQIEHQIEAVKLGRSNEGVERCGSLARRRNSRPAIPSGREWC